MANGWKIIAIVFIVTNIITLSASFGLYYMGSAIVEKEKYCAIEVCDPEYSYSYDPYEERCYCYKNNEVVKEVSLANN